MFFGTFEDLNLRVVVSHISRKTSEIWGTHHPLFGQNLSLENAECLLQADTAGGFEQRGVAWS
jgi:hypothetical protein